MTAPHPAQHPDRDLARSARANGLAGLALTLGLGLALVEVLGLGGLLYRQGPGRLRADPLDT